MSVRRDVALVREALAEARTRPALTVMIGMLAGVMCAAVLLTAGRTVGAQERVLGTIDDAGVRTIMVRLAEDSGVTSEVLSRLDGIDGIAWAAAFGPAQDVVNADIPGGTRVPARAVWGAGIDALGLATAKPAGRAWGSPLAFEQLGMLEGFGGAVGEGGRELAVVGRFAPPDFLMPLEPLLLVPQSEPGPVAMLVVVATRAEQVAPVSELVVSMLDAADAGSVRVVTSDSLIRLRGLIDGELARMGGALVAAILGLTALVVAATLYGVALLRRREFGRRRALGASRRIIVALLIVQTVAAAVPGALLGVGAAVVALLVAGDPVPSAGYLLAVALLAVGTAATGAVLPAVIASRRDPVRELRIP